MAHLWCFKDFFQLYDVRMVHMFQYVYFPFQQDDSMAPCLYNTSYLLFFTIIVPFDVCDPFPMYGQVKFKFLNKSCKCTYLLSVHLLYSPFLMGVHMGGFKHDPKAALPQFPSKSVYFLNRIIKGAINR